MWRLKFSKARGTRSLQICGPLVSSSLSFWQDHYLLKTRMTRTKSTNRSCRVKSSFREMLLMQPRGTCCNKSSSLSPTCASVSSRSKHTSSSQIWCNSTQIFGNSCQKDKYIQYRTGRIQCGLNIFYKTNTSWSTIWARWKWPQSYSSDWINWTRRSKTFEIFTLNLNSIIFLLLHQLVPSLLQ